MGLICSSAKQPFYVQHDLKAPEMKPTVPGSLSSIKAKTLNETPFLTSKLVICKQPSKKVIPFAIVKYSCSAPQYFIISFK